VGSIPTATTLDSFEAHGGLAMSAVLKALIGNVQDARRIKAMQTSVRNHADEGVKCPTCGQFAKVYKRSINAGMAKSLITMYLAGAADDYIYIPDAVGARSREEGKLRYWGLVEEAQTPRPDGGRAGWWKLTDRGVLFVNGKRSVMKYAHVYDGEVVGYSGSQVTIQDCLGTKFDYRELMSI
jgi:hypothetical protein